MILVKRVATKQEFTFQNHSKNLSIFFPHLMRASRIQILG